MKKLEFRLFALYLTLVMLTPGCGDSTGIKDRPSDDSGAQEVLSLASGETLSGQLARGDSQIYRVGSDTHLSLLSTTGNADIFIFDNFSDIDVSELASEAIYSNDAVLCMSTLGFKEDVCTASVTDGEMYVLLHGYTDSQYDITAVNDCSTEIINEWAYRGLTDYYFYADQVPVINSGSYDNPSEMIRDLRFEPLDSYSGIRDTATQTAFFDEGVAFGLGHGWERDSQDNLRIVYVYSDSPFDRAGIKRGDIALTVGGEPLDQNMSNERYFELIGSRENPIVSEWTFLDRETGLTKSLSVQIDEYEVNTVLYSATYDMQGSGGLVGYIVLSNFIEPSRQELNQVIDRFNSQGVNELILDLRYNGGGRSWVSRRLASQIGGSRVQNSAFASFQYNSMYSHFNFAELFPESSPELGLDRLVVLTTEDSASASESLVNSLRPYMEVITIGEKSEGKAFRSYGRQFCGKTLNLMEVQGVNANGVSVAGGIPADCYAADDLARPFGTESGAMEGMLGKGFDYLANGRCDTAPLIARKAQTAAHFPLTAEMMFIGGDGYLPERK